MTKIKGFFVDFDWDTLCFFSLGSSLRRDDSRGGTVEFVSHDWSDQVCIIIFRVQFRKLFHTYKH